MATYRRSTIDAFDFNLRYSAFSVSEFIGYDNHDRPHNTDDYLSPAKFKKLRLNQVNEIEIILGTK